MLIPFFNNNFRFKITIILISGITIVKVRGFTMQPFKIGFVKISNI